MNARERILWALGGVCLALAVLCGFVLPGVRFSGVLFGGLAVWWVLLILLNRWTRKSRIGKACKAILLALFFLGLTVFAVTECAIVYQGEAAPPDIAPDAVIVLGAGVNGTTPSLALRTRIDAAEDYLAEHPGVPVVLSGGQGAGEEISEARAMYDALTADGVDPARLLLEETSASTAENFRYSKALLRKNGVDPETAVTAVVTNDFHMFRARLIARREGMDVIGVPAELPWRWLSANYYVREFFALGKLLIV